MKWQFSKQSFEFVSFTLKEQPKLLWFMKAYKNQKKHENGAAEMHCLTKRQAVDQLLPIRSFATYQREREHLASHQSYLALHF